MKKQLFLFAMLLISVGAWAAAYEPITNLETGYYTLKGNASGAAVYAKYYVGAQYLAHTPSADKDFSCAFYIENKGDGTYTIRLWDGKYVTWKVNNANGDQIALTDAPTDGKELWKICVGKDGGEKYVIAPGNTTPGATTPGFNFAVTVNGANNALGFWRCDDGNSQWTLTKTTEPEDYYTSTITNFAIGTWTKANGAPYSTGWGKKVALGNSALTITGSDDESLSWVTSGSSTRRPGLRQGKTFTISLPTEYEIKSYELVTYPHNFGNGKFTYSTNDGTADQQLGSNNAESTTTVSEYKGNTITIAVGNATDATGIAVIKSLKISYRIKSSALTNLCNTIGDPQVGTDPGYYRSQEDVTALTAAKDAAEEKAGDGTGYILMSDITALQNAIIAANPQMIMLEVGKYYRIQNTAHKTYTGLNSADIYSLKMKNVVYNENNPTLIWKYVQDGNNYYLQNVFSGLYPQYVVAGSSSTTETGLRTANYKFTYETYAKATSTTKPIWIIKFGDLQVNVESSGNVNWWYETNARHYIYNVEASEEELATMCEAWYKGDTVQGSTIPTYNKIEIHDDATQIISPAEFDSPRVINELIDTWRLSTDETVTQEKIHKMFTDETKLNKYQSAINSYGSLLSMPYTPTAEWGTIILPINWSIPNGWTCYSCSGAEGNVLTLTQKSSTEKNKPYIINAGTRVGTTYQFIGYSNGALETNQTEGWLTGVLQDEAFNCPVNSYVLAKYNDVIGFYQVETGAEIQVPKYKCYLTPQAATEARFGSFFFDATETGIESMDEVEGSSNAVIYDLAGRRVQNAQKGLYIVNGKKIIR